ncbi:MAG TPA: sigma-54-dependent Fis family transcriptional regulator [Bacteroidetes bacterium]|nr:MAG: sigma-54-dependent Fis family transcriptional regulator [Ignavibacteria bacterium GWA2_54_16]HCA80636.1 sigma-54-dependent Fis family transcriptional regulator [Bacteroidota bacterium]
MPQERQVYIVDDEETISRLLEHWATKKWGYQARTFATGEDCLEALAVLPDLVLLDIMLPGIGGVETLKRIKSRYPDLPVIMLSAQGKVDVAIETLKIGATDYFSKPVDFAKLEVSVKNAIQTHDLAREVTRLREAVGKPVHFENIISDNGAMQEVFKLVQKVKDNDICVLVLGESGTGKELIARAIHYNGIRAKDPFVVVNCASIPHDLLESELFGHEKGAFTGAHQRRIGKFEQASGGTLFLDEIGELDLSLQAKLLRVIQNKQFERVGGNETLTTDVRLVSATNRDLVKMVSQKMFREDLYFRLATFPIMLPPLRDRRSDILLLAEHFLKKFAGEVGKTDLGITRKALKLLYEYAWPGNIRELENAIQRAVLMADGPAITEKDIPMAVVTFGSHEDANNNSPLTLGPEHVRSMDRMKEENLRQALASTNGNIVEAARKLKIGRATMYRLMKRYSITERR